MSTQKLCTGTDCTRDQNGQSAGVGRLRRILWLGVVGPVLNHSTQEAEAGTSSSSKLQRDPVLEKKEKERKGKKEKKRKKKKEKGEKGNPKEQGWVWRVGVGVG